MTNSVESIKEVQAAEGHAETLVANAKRDRDNALIDAKDKASRMISESEESAKAKKAEAIRKLTEELDRRTEKALKDAAYNAKSIKSKKLSNAARVRITKELTDSILGA